MLLVLHKPFDVLSQFTPDHPGQRTLAECGLPPRVYALGRLDRDSEGMLLLSDEPGLNARLLDPENGHPRAYWAQVEGIVTDAALQALAAGVVVQGQRTRPARVRRLEPAPEIAPRVPPIRQRAQIPDCWIELELTEGRNRQVRRMTAAVGFPTLRLIRVRTGDFPLPPELAPGKWRVLTHAERQAVFVRR